MRAKFYFLMCFLLCSCDSSKPVDWVKPDTITISCENYYAHQTGSGIFYNNVWNKDAAKDFPWRQCVEKSVDGQAYGWSWNWPAKSNSIFAYPQIKIGKSPWAPDASFDERFPVKNTQVSSLHIKHNVEIQGVSQHNLATSLWLTRTGEIGSAPNPSVIVAEFMVWTYYTKEHMNPAGKLVSSVKLDDKEWEVWVDKNWTDASGVNKNTWIYVTFRAKQNQLKTEFDVVPLTNYAIEKNYLPKEFFYADIELGNEIMSGAGLAWVKEFDINLVQQ